MNKYEIKFKIKTKYLRKFVNSLGAMFLFIFGFVPIVSMFGSFVYPLFRIVGVIGRDDPLSYWWFLIYIPLVALIMTFGSKLMRVAMWCWDKAGDLTDKIDD